MAQLLHLTDTGDLTDLREQLEEDPQSVKGFTRSQMEAHMQMRAAKIETEIIRRYTGRNAVLRDAKYVQALERDLGPKILVWTAESRRLSRERRARFTSPAVAAVEDALEGAVVK